MPNALGRALLFGEVLEVAEDAPRIADDVGEIPRPVGGGAVAREYGLVGVVGGLNQVER